MSRFYDSVVEDTALEWLEALGWRVVHGPDIAPETLDAERTSYGEVALRRRRATRRRGSTRIFR